MGIMGRDKNEVEMNALAFESVVGMAKRRRMLDRERGNRVDFIGERATGKQSCSLKLYPANTGHSIAGKREMRRPGNGVCRHCRRQSNRIISHSNHVERRSYRNLAVRTTPRLVRCPRRCVHRISDDSDSRRGSEF